ncbi:MAG: RidA family protein [Anaerolineae bacterium]|nr:RidA family protein [Anaerolineae bacterium]MCB0200529.1 RidA family protein [Anaerolineae bacterium]MCB0204593.1 RidA family protein [Anaerolineae bacterium]MCB0252944.1 RidA family protein [Anaerolineae bacterium]
MSREVIATPHAPAAVGPYSQAIRTGGLVFTAGQIGLDPATGKLVEGLENQAEQVMANLRAVLAAAGSSLDQAIKTTIFLADMADFAQVNAIYGRAFNVMPPARSTIQAAGLPLGALVEIEVIALSGG